MTMFDSVIVGGGLGGLLCGAELARAGLAVAVLESADRVGGRAGSDQRGGQWVDRGAHAVFVGGALHRALGRHGLLDHTEPVPLSGVQVAVDGVLHDLTATTWLTASWLAARDRRALWRAAAALTWGGGRGSLHEVVVDPLPAGRGRQLVEAMLQISTYCGDLDRLDARRCRPHVLRALGRGVRYVHGGWQRLADELTRCIRARGGVVRSRTTVRAVEGGTVRTRAGDVHGRTVVLAVPARVAARLSGVDLARPEEGVRVGSLAVVLPRDRVPGPRRRAVVSLDHPTFLVDFGAVVDLGPRDHTVVHVTHYRSDREHAEDQAKASLATWCPDWASHAVHVQWLPRLASHPSLPDAPRRAQLGPSMFWVSAATGDGLLADGVAASALRVARQVGDQLLRSVA